MSLLLTIKRDFARHRQKAAVLGVLFAVMVFMGVRAVFQMHPQTADASVAETAGVELAGMSPTNDGLEAGERIKLSKELWKKLRETRGVQVKDAFAFESSYFSPDPSRPVPTVAPVQVDPMPVVKQDDGEIARRALLLRIREQLLELRVQSTTVGNGKPWAIVNGQLVSVGDMVKGFEITAIRARQVEFKKEGVTSAVSMPDELRGQ